MSKEIKVDPKALRLERIPFKELKDDYFAADLLVDQWIKCQLEVELERRGMWQCS